MAQAGATQPNGGDLASSLEPVLRESCDARLGPIEWFRSTWQRGGASTGFSTWTRPDGTTVDAMVKIPVGPTEYRWTTLLGFLDERDWDSETGLAAPTPRVLACGEVLAGYDLGWIVIERLRDRPISSDWNKTTVKQLLQTVCELHVRALSAAPNVASPAKQTDWRGLIERSRELARNGEIDDAQRWNTALKRARKLLDRAQQEWASRDMHHWCHGDVHPGNACLRHHGDASTCVLIDLSRMHGGHWLEDALQLEYLHWGHEDQLFGVSPVRELRRLRRARGLDPGGDSTRLADIWRVLAAAAIPGAATGATPPSRLAAGLGHLEGALKRVL